MSNLPYQNLIQIAKSSKCKCCSQGYALIYCDGCKKEMPYHSEEYLVIYGNITLGHGGGLIGNNFDDEGILNRVTVLCKNCFMEYFQAYGFDADEEDEFQYDIYDPPPNCNEPLVIKKVDEGYPGYNPPQEVVDENIHIGDFK